MIFLCDHGCAQNFQVSGVKRRLKELSEFFVSKAGVFNY